MRTLTSLDGYLASLRPILESLYFLSAVALAIFAYRALAQLKLTREIANRNTQREAFKLAAEECRYFGEHIVALGNKAWEECKELKITCFENRQFKVRDGEIVEHNFDRDLLLHDLVRKETNGHPPHLLTFLNSLEGFSIFFVKGIAEDSVGYQETASTFCSWVKTYMSAIWLQRSVGVRYESTVKLYGIWSNRLEAEALARNKETIDAVLRGAKDKVIPRLGEM